MTLEFRNKLSGGTAGNAVTSLTLLNAAGPSNFTGQSLTAAKWATNPGAGEATVLEIDITATGKQRLDYTPGSNDTKISTSLVVYLSALPPSGSSYNLQVIDVQASDAGTGRDAVAINIPSTGILGMKQASTASAAVYPSTGITIAAGKSYRINMWADLGGDNTSGSGGVAIYDVSAGTQVGSTYTFSGANLGGATSQFTATYFGKVDTANQGITLYVSDAAISYGVAHDFGANPSMSVPTPPGITFLQNRSGAAGGVIEIYSRGIPTTSGATEGQFKVTTLSAVNTVTGAAVTLDSTNTPLWSAPTSGTETNRKARTTLPRIGVPMTYTLRGTTTDSNSQSNSQTFTLTVSPEDVVIGGVRGSVTLHH